MENSLNERMGFDDSIPKDFIDKVYNQYLKTSFARRSPKWETLFTVKTPDGIGFPEELTFVVEKGFGDDYYDAAVFRDGTVHLNVDELSRKSVEEVKSAIAHELTHINQHGKIGRGERGEGEYGYNKAVNAGKISDKERRASLWMMENLQETEIEARLSQIYYYVKEVIVDVTPKGNAIDFVNTLVDNMEDITKLNDLQKSISATENILSGTYAYYINLFVKDAQNALYGAVKKKSADLEQSKRIGMSLLSVYKKRFERYRRKVYNAVYQAIQDTLNKDKASRF